jgi:hypothetical protein
VEVWELPSLYKLSALLVLYTYLSFRVSCIVPFIPWHIIYCFHHSLTINVTSQQPNSDSYVIISSTKYLYLHMKIFRHRLMNSRVKDPETHGRQHKRPQLHITLHRPTVSTFWKKRRAVKPAEIAVWHILWHSRLLTWSATLT